MSAAISFAAERQRRHRERVRGGRVVLAVEVDANAIEAMLMLGWVDEPGSRSRETLAGAISEALADWAEKIRHASRL